MLIPVLHDDVAKCISPVSSHAGVETQFLPSATDATLIESSSRQPTDKFGSESQGVCATASSSQTLADVMKDQITVHHTSL